MNTTAITLIAKNYGADLPIEIIKKIIDGTKDKSLWLKHVRQKWNPDRLSHVYMDSEHQMLINMVVAYCCSWDHILHPGQKRMDQLDDTQKNSLGYLNLRAQILEIHRQQIKWKTLVPKHKRQYNICPGIGNEVLSHTIEGTYTEGKFTTKELESIWPSLYGANGWAKNLPKNSEIFPEIAKGRKALKRGIGVSWEVHYRRHRLGCPQSFLR